ncbi:MAG TPA: hypothetical protein VMG14_01535 [Thermoplasmata archaeon]|jgi:hypothetical protein|nr:hypothetical protein [Thermoplasmata archaeon]
MAPDDPAQFKERIAATLDAHPDEPWCTHRIFETLAPPAGPFDRDRGIDSARRAADELAAEGRVLREYVSAVAIGVHCDDSLYWSLRSGRRQLAEFGPEYESPTILRRLGAHFECHGL